MTVTERPCRANDPETCRVHGTFFFPKNKMSYTDHARESEKLKMFLNPNEQKALTDYLNQDFMEMNAYLHGAELTTSPQTLKRIEYLDTALKKYAGICKGQEITTYRATKCYQAFKNQEEAQQWFSQSFPVNGKVKLAGFTSTTPNPDALFDFLPESHADLTPHIGSWLFPTQKDWDDYLASEPDEGLGNIVFIMKTRTGAPVAGYGQTFDEKEHEFLIARDKEFTVEEVASYRKVVNPYRHQNMSRSSAHATIITLREV